MEAVKQGEASGLEVEVLGGRNLPAGGPSAATLRRWARRAALALGVARGHLAVHVVGEEEIAALNGRFRGKPRPTDVLAFPIDEGQGQPAGPPAELGDVFICPAQAEDLVEVVVHGVLHLLGMDHEQDDGEMLALQEALLRGRR